MFRGPSICPIFKSLFSILDSSQAAVHDLFSKTSLLKLLLLKLNFPRVDKVNNNKVEPKGGVEPWLWGLGGGGGKGGVGSTDIHKVYVTVLFVTSQRADYQNSWLVFPEK